MDLKLRGKVALITGSSSGIGLEIAKKLAFEGCHVVLNGRCPVRLKKALELIPGSNGVIADVCDPISCQHLIQKVLDLHGCIDVLICNVGSGDSMPPGHETPDEWHRVFGVNLYSTTQIVWAATDSLIESKGNIVCISSICGIEALGCPITYASAKAALESYVRNSARVFGPRNVRINSIAPGNILFEGSVWERKIKQDKSAVNAMLKNEVALQRLGKPQDIAQLVAYVASPLASFITGATYVVDGGQLRS